MENAKSHWHPPALAKAIFWFHLSEQYLKGQTLKIANQISVYSSFNDSTWGNICYFLRRKYDQEIPESHTAGQPTALWGRDTEHEQSQNIRKTIKVEQRALSFSLFFAKVIAKLERTLSTTWKHTSEIENLQNFETGLYWVCSWDFMKKAIAIVLPSTDLNAILLSVVWN